MQSAQRLLFPGLLLGASLLLGCSSSGSKAATAITPTTQTFTLTSGVGIDGGTLPIDYTGDGSGVSPDLSWSGAPSGTEEFALLMTTLPGDGTTLWNWVLYGIPATATGLDKSTSGVGTAGMSSHAVLGYAPPMSKGPGLKVYTFTLYALSASPSLPSDPTQVTGEVLTEAISSVTLASTSLSFGYTRTAPVAAFSSVGSGTTVTFTSTCGISTTTWAWDFGDESISADPNPSHTYASAGTYTVSLTATNDFGSTTVTSTVSVSAASRLPSSSFIPDHGVND